MDNLFGEFFGTMILLTFGCGVVANVLLERSKGQNGGWIVIVTGWAMAVLLGIFGAQATGAPQADLNPAVTLFKALNGVYQPGHAFMTMLAELLGGIAGGILTFIIYYPHWEHTSDKGAKLAIFSTGPAVRNIPSNFVTEMTVTFILLTMIMCIFNPKVTGATGFVSGMGQYLVSMLIWGIGLSLGGPTGYAINPARDLGPRIAHAILPIPGKGDSDWGYAWVPVVAPLVGAVLAFFFTKAVGII